MTGVEQTAAKALIATRLRITGGIDITLRSRESGTTVRLRVIAREGLEGGGSLLLPDTTSNCFAFQVKSAGCLDGESVRITRCSLGGARLPKNPTCSQGLKCVMLVGVNRPKIVPSRGIRRDKLCRLQRPGNGSARFLAPSSMWLLNVTSRCEPQQFFGSLAPPRIASAPRT